MTNERIYKQMAEMIPAGIRKTIKEEGFIAKAINTEVQPSIMEYLFDVYEEFLDKNGEHDLWTCWKCREHILNDWKKMAEYL